MSTTKAERLAKIHAAALSEFNMVWSAVAEERRQCLEDRRFYSVAGAQWEGGLGDQFENKPRFEMNKVHLAVIRIINEYRNNRIAVEFNTKDGADQGKLVDTCSGLYRADEQDSSAQEAYDNAFEEGVGGGFGAWRVRAVYEDEDDDDNDHQRISMEPIFDADTCVFFDLGAKRQDKADATKCWVLSGMTRDAYIEEYDDDPVTWDKEENSNGYDWCNGDTVYIAEYYKVEDSSELVTWFKGIALGDDEPNEKRVTESEFEADPELRATLEATGFRQVRQKRVKTKQVHKYLMSGSKILEDCGIIAGKNIPIIPFYGKRWYVDGIERCMGHVRLAKDPQRLKNMLISSLADISSQFSAEKPIFTAEQVAGHTQMWSEDNIVNNPYLLVNPITDQNGQQMPAGPLAYTKAPSLPPALAGLLQVTEQDLQDLLGNQQAGEQMQPNMSGKAIELIQNRLDMQVFIYMSNMSKAVKRCGEVWLDMKREISVEPGRKMKVISSGGESGSIELMKPVHNKETGETEIENDLTDASFDVNVDVGPSSVSRRAATVRALSGLLQFVQAPEDVQVLTGMILQNIEGEGLSDVNDYYRKKLVTMGALKPTEEEQKELDAQAQANAQQVDPNAEFLKASAQKAQADAAKAQADTMQSMAKTAQAKADTIATLAGVEQGREAHALQLAQGLQGMQQAQVQQAAEESEPQPNSDGQNQGV
jgi:hypothetical protein